MWLKLFNLKKRFQKLSAGRDAAACRQPSGWLRYSCRRLLYGFNSNTDRSVPKAFAVSLCCVCSGSCVKLILLVEVCPDLSGNHNYCAYHNQNRNQSRNESGSEMADRFATETLARIFQEQGRVEEARRIYSRLILEIPEKSAYFASLIDNLDK